MGASTRVPTLRRLSAWRSTTPLADRRGSSKQCLRPPVPGFAATKPGKNSLRRLAHAAPHPLLGSAAVGEHGFTWHEPEYAPAVLVGDIRPDDACRNALSQAVIRNVGRHGAGAPVGQDGSLTQLAPVIQHGVESDGGIVIHPGAVHDSPMIDPGPGPDNRLVSTLRGAGPGAPAAADLGKVVDVSVVADLKAPDAYDDAGANLDMVTNSYLASYDRSGFHDGPIADLDLALQDY